MYWQLRIKGWGKRIGTVLLILAASIAASVVSYAETFTLVKGADLIGEPKAYSTAEGDTLTKIAEAHFLRVSGLINANPGVDPWLPGTNRILVLPTTQILPNGPRDGMVLNLPEQRIYHYLPKERVQVIPFSIGHESCELATGQTKIKKRRRLPSWRPPPDVRALRPDLPKIVPPGSGNPLGGYAVDLELEGLIIHGAAHPFIRGAIGYGCIQVYPEHAKLLYQSVKPGTEVHVVDQPVKFGWSDGEMFIEVHPTVEEAKTVAGANRFRPANLAGLDNLIDQFAGENAARVDQALVLKAASERSGVPLKITRKLSPPRVKKVRGLFGN